MFKALWKMFFPKYPQAEFTTVKYAFPLVVITALFASLAAVISGDGSYVTIRTDVDTVIKDERFFIDVAITARVPINAIDLVIKYPENQIVIESVDVGTSVITLWTEEPYARSGSIYLRGGTFRKGFLGEHTIARIRARAIESGEARILIESTQLVAGDGQGTEVKAVPNSAYNQTKIFVTADSEGKITGEVAISVVTDINGDGVIDFADITAFMSAWFTKKNTYDFNGDGKMNFKDFSILLAESFFKRKTD